MSVYTWYTADSNFVCSFDDSLPTIKDRIRALIGDVNGVPVAYLSDNTINAIAANHGNDLYTAAAECAESCATRATSLYQEIRQGTRFEMKNFDIAKIIAAFRSIADDLRDKSTIGVLPSYGIVGGSISTCGPNGTPWNG